MRSNRGLPAAMIAAVLVVLGTAGCTMCPDPFDYSGPVAGGGPAQNDFGARSNGILPVRAAPTPWPAVVSDGPVDENDEDSANAESVLIVAEEPPATMTR